MKTHKRTTQGTRKQLFARLETLMWRNARRSLRLACSLTSALAMAACAVREQPARTILPEPQWTEDGWQFRREPLLRSELPDLRERSAPAPVPHQVPPDNYDRNLAEFTAKTPRHQGGL